MSLPGFTAEASVFRTSTTYRNAYRAFTSNGSVEVIPQQFQFCPPGCRCVCPTPPCSVDLCPPFDNRQCCPGLQCVRGLCRGPLGPL